jgi:hypothetical protein
MGDSDAPQIITEGRENNEKDGLPPAMRTGASTPAAHAG